MIPQPVRFVNKSCRILLDLHKESARLGRPAQNRPKSERFFWFKTSSPPVEDGGQRFVNKKEDMIIYKSLKDSATWARPKSMWNDVVDDNGTLRFTLC